MKLSEKVPCSNGCKKTYHQIGREPLPDCNRTRVAQLEDVLAERKEQIDALPSIGK